MILRQQHTGGYLCIPDGIQEVIIFGSIRAQICKTIPLADLCMPLWLCFSAAAQSPDACREKSCLMRCIEIYLLQSVGCKIRQSSHF